MPRSYMDRASLDFRQAFSQHDPSGTRSDEPQDWENGPHRVIQALLDGGTTQGESFEDLYRTSYNCVLFGMGDEVYADINRLFDDGAQRAGRRLSAISDPEPLARAFLEEWSVYSEAIEKTRAMCKYLDKIHLGQSRPPKDSIYVAARKSFLTQVVKREDNRLGERLQNAEQSPDLGDLAGQIREVLDQFRSIHSKP